ncbi:nuclear transport factor 2 family protein [Nocardia sp. NBC_01503]|uniref:nuclear transport factor 2 family protein n=1 Tax=Nocardia sp. NBC_01503 TaxID=2975997 RepID=UPI002E7ABF11|nr:nuclear transport factor 2 family protein [Nocardia sp. NBC_01503]WTL32590.1 nuclear transport factor 2 family protein [Nocardia sp. NBC_01503]
MPADPLTILHKFYAAEAAYVRGDADLDAMLAHLAPNVLMSQASVLPYGGDWHGPLGFAGFLRAFAATWADLEFLDQRFVSDADTVAVHSRGRLTSRVTGRTLETELIQWITFHDGLITAFRPFYLDTAAVLATLEPDRTDAAPAELGTARSDLSALGRS